ncbi:P-loop containing nucleoside triphosphate hydrolase protein [Mytilinidion resinicola]|uniref:P-loop containing nucleoside triphosphate hydrolase protein n=1 Tax=Mytilinidion resinicola TaxID=574789 RepID=A0A6A6Z2C3_9PEZI|nr:P-loop containing nucleoside triphosphate hydrolase protein [Mytilinidion resinicola]KAF2814377.1 P-loop containing nucleoside triphosphate hydrolase protein [Mytilinidion resinicola]
MGHKYIQINSAAVINALRAVVEYYPGQNLIDDTITIPEPYTILVHHEKELVAYRENFGEADSYEHLGIVFEFLQQTLKDSLGKEMERHARAIPVTTYEMLWTLFKPGTDVYYDTHSCGILDSYVVKSINWEINNGSPVRYTLCLWNLYYDSIYIGPRNHLAIILPFDGEKEIASLDIFPCEYVNMEKHKETAEEMRKRLEERGKMFYRLTSKQCMWYDGLTTTFPKHRFTGLVYVDSESFWTSLQADKPPPSAKMAPNSPPPLLSDDVGERSIGGIPNCFCKRCVKLNSRNRKNRFADYARINPITGAELTPHQLFLCDRSVHGFILKVRNWHRLDASCFSEPKYDVRLVDELVIAPTTRNLIKCLSSKYTRSDPKPAPDRAITTSTLQTQDQWTADFVQGKGEGLIFLLHGKPGVGKTYTAECIAEYTKRPLLSLTCTDIGTNPMTIESKLTYWFKLAKHWGAILLIDEADIYMEQRITQDLQRNNLVAGFLRAMEYYQGILFLTTNRIGTFDEAFMSRIHVSVHYPDFRDEERGEVWDAFFRKLERERGTEVVVGESARRYVKESREVRGVKWNGREIRNAFQTAVALAEVESDKDDQARIIVKDQHIRSIVRMSAAFKKYLNTLHGDQSQRAARQGLRVDDFDEKEGDGKGAFAHYV